MRCSGSALTGVCQTVLVERRNAASTPGSLSGICETPPMPMAAAAIVAAFAARSWLQAATSVSEGTGPTALPTPSHQDREFKLWAPSICS